jgi:hypothetical protein
MQHNIISPTRRLSRSETTSKSIESSPQSLTKDQIDGIEFRDVSQKSFSRIDFSLDNSVISVDKIGNSESLQVAHGVSRPSKRSRASRGLPSSSSSSSTLPLTNESVSQSLLAVSTALQESLNSAPKAVSSMDDDDHQWRPPSPGSPNSRRSSSSLSANVTPRKQLRFQSKKFQDAGVKHIPLGISRIHSLRPPRPRRDSNSDDDSSSIYTRGSSIVSAPAALGLAAQSRRLSKDTSGIDNCESASAMPDLDRSLNATAFSNPGQPVQVTRSLQVSSVLSSSRAQKLAASATAANVASATVVGSSLSPQKSSEFSSLKAPEAPPEAIQATMSASGITTRRASAQAGLTLQNHNPSARAAKMRTDGCHAVSFPLGISQSDDDQSSLPIRNNDPQDTIVEKKVSNGALAGVPASIVERVKAKEAARLHSKEISKSVSDMIPKEKFPILLNKIVDILISKKLLCISMTSLIDAQFMFFNGFYSKAQLEQSIKKVAEVCPSWCSIIPSPPTKIGEQVGGPSGTNVSFKVSQMNNIDTVKQSIESWIGA